MKNNLDTKAPIGEKESLLLNAVSNGKIEEVKALINCVREQGSPIDLNVRDENGNSPLMIAIYLGYKDIVDLLICARVDKNASNEDGDTALIIAVRGGHKKIAEFLITTGADKNASNKDGDTALITALRNEHKSIAQSLIYNSRADINMSNKDGDTALMISARKAYGNMVQVLIENEADVNLVNKKGETALMIAEERKYYDIAIRLKQAKINQELIFAVKSNDYNAVNALIKGADVNTKDKEGNSILVLAADKGYEDIVQTLIHNGANVNLTYDDWDVDSALILAAGNGHESIVQMLIKHGANVNEQGLHSETALMRAARNGYKNIVQILIKHGADVNEKDVDQCTALSEAAENGHEDIVQVLIEHNADIDVPNYDDGWTALVKAVNGGHEGIARILINNGANVNAFVDYGYTLLMLAANSGREGIMRMLINNGANVNARNDEGETALMIAERREHHSMVTFLKNAQEEINQGLFNVAEYDYNEVKTLIERGADVNTRSENGDTPLAYAIGNDQLDIVKILLENKADINICNKEGISAFSQVMDGNALYEIQLELIKHQYSFNIQNEEGLTPLHFAGDKRAVKLLLKHGAYLNIQDKQGNTPLMTAIIKGELKVAEALIKAGAKINIKNNEGKDIFDIGLTNPLVGKFIIENLHIISNKLKLVEIDEQDNKEIQKNKIITTLLYEAQRHNLEEEPCKSLVTILKLLIGGKDIFYYKNKENKIIECNITSLIQLQEYISKEETKNTEFYGSYLSDDSDSENEEHDDYISLRQKTIATLNKAYQKSFLVKIKEDTRAAFTFDSLKRSLRERQQIGYPETLDKNNAQEALNKINKLITDGSTIEQALEEIKSNPELREAKFFIAQYRGVNYNTTKWNKPAREGHRQEDEVGKPYYSASVLFGATRVNNFCELHKLQSTLTPEQNIELNQAITIWDNALKDKLLAARKTGKHSYNGYIYNNLAELLQDLYTKNYDKFTSFASYSKILQQYLLNYHNPFISTGDVPYHALKYAYGIKFYEGHKDERLRPRWRKSGKAERPYSGKVYLSLHPLEDYAETGALHVVSLNAQGRVIIDNITVPERETSFPASIPAERIIKTHIAKYPSFHRGYKTFYLEKYGLTRTMYLELQRKFISLQPHTDGMERFKQILGEWLCSYHEVKMIELARKKAEELGGILIYRGIDGLFTMQLPVDTPMRKASDIKDKTVSVRAARGNSIHHNNRNIVGQVIREISDREDVFVQGAIPYEEFTELIINQKLNELKSNIFPGYYYWGANDKLTTPLHLAVDINKLSIVEYLLQHKAFLDVRDSEGNTPLHLAVINKNIEVISCLVKHGANNRIPNNFNKTPFDLARETGDKELETSLLSFEEKEKKIKELEKELNTLRSVTASLSYRQRLQKMNDDFVEEVETSAMEHNTRTNLARVAVAFYKAENDPRINMNIIAKIAVHSAIHPLEEEGYPRLSEQAAEKIITKWQEFIFKQNSNTQHSMDIG
ncbi:ankyrin repeat domain-containing protein [Candidatus Jidaibacter acanthamoebae]|nr:ankyrin repeat domain-containing protein [Candidatus Jidaibacter acanthamoeba]